jgi:hypothetical protein
MRRILLVAGVVLISFVMLSSCNLLKGQDGSAYIQATLESGVDGIMYSTFEGFPSGWSLGTEYSISEGYYSNEYVLYWSAYSSGDAHSSSPHYDTHFNAGWLIYGSSISGNLSYYAGNYYASYHNSFSYDITVNPGRFPFRNGEDKHLTLEFMWDPNSTNVSSLMSGALAAIVEDSATQVVKELTEGDLTFRLVLPKSAISEERAVAAE